MQDMGILLLMLIGAMIAQMQRNWIVSKYSDG